MSFAEDKQAALAALDRATAALNEGWNLLNALKPDPPPPPPPPAGPPSGTVVAADDCTTSTAAAVSLWGGYQGPGLHKLEHHPTGGPNGGPFRRFLLAEGDRQPGEPTTNERNEFGGRDFCTFEVGKRYVTRFWTRVPAIPSGQYRTIFQWKHTESNVVSTSPPLNLLQNGNGTLSLKERAGDYNGRDIWEGAIPINAWFEVAFDILYARQGHVDVWLDGKKVGAVDAPTVKELTDGTVSDSYPRCGIYQRATMTATWRDLGPTRIERIA
jgi:hypothetical protein